MSKQPVRRPVRPAPRRVVKKKPVQAAEAKPLEAKVPEESATVASAPVEQSAPPVKEVPVSKPKPVIEKPVSHNVPSEDSNDSSGNKKGLLPLILVVLILVGVSGVLAWRLISVKEELASKDSLIKAAEDAKELAIKDAKKEIDAMEARMTELADQSKAIGANNDELLAQIEDLKAQKAYLARKAAKGGSGISLSELNSLRSKLAEQNKMLLAKEEKIQHLTKVNYKLKGQMNKIIEKQGKMVSELNTLEERVTAASVLFLETLQPTVINEKGEYVTDADNQFKNKKIDKLRIVCTMDDNKIAPHDSYEFWLAIQDPEGNTFIDSGSSGSLIEKDANSNDISVTAKKSLDFENAHEKVVFTYAQNKECKNGTYKVIVYQEGVPVGESEFDLH